MYWMNKYQNQEKDTCKAVYITQGGRKTQALCKECKLILLIKGLFNKPS